MVSSRTLFPIALATLTLLAMGRLTSCEFISSDDEINIARNPRFDPPTPAKLAYYWSHFEHGLYVPVTYSAWGLIASVARVGAPGPMGSLNPWLFHSANLLVHLCTSILVYSILRNLKFSEWAAFIGACVFAIHPVQVEAVGWTAGLKDVLAGCFGIAAIWQYLKFAENKFQCHFIIATFVLVLALLSKPSAVVIPPIAFAIDWLILRRTFRTILKSLGAWFVIAMIFAFIARRAQPAIEVESLPIWQRPFLAIDALAFYIGKLVWPFQLAIDYGWKPTELARQWWFYFGGIMPVCLGFLAIFNRKQNRRALAATLIFLFGVSPVLGLLNFLYEQFSLTADHYLYISIFGIAILVAALIDRFNVIFRHVVATIVIALLAIQTFRQTAHWKNDFTLFNHTLAINPDSAPTLNNLARAHLMRGEPEKAERILNDAIARYPNRAEFRQAMTVAYQAMGRDDDAQAQAKIRDQILRANQSTNREAP